MGNRLVWIVLFLEKWYNGNTEGGKWSVTEIHKWIVLIEYYTTPQNVWHIIKYYIPKRTIEVMINRLTNRYYSFKEKTLINLNYQLLYYDNGVLGMASTQNASLWRSNLDLFWECHEESSVFYINMTWRVQIGVREESVNLLSRTSIHKKAAFGSDSHFRKCSIQNFIFLCFYFWRKQANKRLFAKIKVFRDNLGLRFWNDRIQILESNFLVLSNRYGRKCTRLRSLGSEKFAFALQSHIRTVEDIIQSAIAKRRMAIERLLAQ